jgi:hypothetical protein
VRRRAVGLVFGFLVGLVVGRFVLAIFFFFDRGHLLSLVHGKLPLG